MNRLSGHARGLLCLFLCLAAVSAWAGQRSVDPLTAAKDTARVYHDARWNPLHFKPAIDTATDRQCLRCHANISTRKPLAKTPAGVPADETLAWYQTLDTYSGQQDTFHRRHLDTPFARRLMNLHCNSCHRGHNPDKEVAVNGDARRQDADIRKKVDPDICVMCHGKFDYTVMPGLTGPWTENSERFQNNCLACHRAFRTNRHQLNFLNAKAIEDAADKDGDVCYGCHGGRAWYAIPYPYVRRDWPRMPSITPGWAANRPTRYDARFTQQKGQQQ